MYSPYRSKTIRCAVVLFAGFYFLGCAGRTEEFSKKIEQLQLEIRKLKAANSLAQDRLETLEQLNSRPAVNGIDTTETQPDGRPSLKVVRLAPAQPGPAQYADEEPLGSAAYPHGVQPNDGPRPVIRANQYGASVTKTGSYGASQPRTATNKRPATAPPKPKQRKKRFWGPPRPVAKRPPSPKPNSGSQGSM